MSKHDVIQQICEWIEEIHKTERVMKAKIMCLEFEASCGNHHLRFIGIRDLLYIFQCDQCDAKKEFLLEDLTLPQRDAITALGYKGKE